jgi:hypothetical protein
MLASSHKINSNKYLRSGTQARQSTPGNGQFELITLRKCNPSLWYFAIDIGGPP